MNILMLDSAMVSVLNAQKNCIPIWICMTVKKLKNNYPMGEFSMVKTIHDTGSMRE